MIITRAQLAEIFTKLDKDGNNVIDEAEFCDGYHRVNPEADKAAISAKWAAVSKSGPVTIDVLAQYWGIKLGTDDVDTDEMSDEKIVEVMALRGLVISIEEERKKRDEEAEAVKAAEAMLARASLGRSAGGRASRRNSRELMPGGGVREREQTRRESKVVQLRASSNVLQSEQSAEVSFLQAADVGEHDAVLKYIAAKGNVNVCDDRQETVLHKVCRIPPQEPSRWRELFSALKAAGLEMDYMDKRGKTALFTAAEYGRKDVVNWLITNGADINWLSNEWQTVLHQALVSNKADVVKPLLSDQHKHKIEDVNALDAQGRTALHIASFKADPEIIQLLLDAKADPSIADGNKYTAERLAERTGRRNSASLLHQAAMGQAAAAHIASEAHK